MGSSWMKRLILAGIFALSIPVVGSAAFADDEESAMMSFLKSIEFGGFVDTYYSYNFNTPRAGGAPRETENVRFFDIQDNSFTLANAELQISKEATEDHRVGFGIVTMFGEIAREIDWNDRPSTGHDATFTIQQGYVTYLAPIGKGLLIKMGRFATWIGYELIESVDNPNYSRSLLFNHTIPFTHSGISASYPFADNVAVTGFLVNGWDNFVDDNTAKTFGYQVAVDVAENLFVALNASHGAEQPGNSHDVRHLWDLVVTYSPMDKVTLGLNYDHGTEENVGNWHGCAIIGQYFFTDAVDVALRGEWLKDSGSRAGGLGTIYTGPVELYEVTATINIKVAENLLLRPEVRYDWVAGSDKEFFAEDDGADDSQFTAALAAAYIF